MSKGNRLKDQIVGLVKEAARDENNTNVASAVNTGGSGNRTHVKSSKRVVQKDGVTTTTERREERIAE